MPFDAHGVLGKHARLLLIFGWFAVLIIYNIVSNWPQIAQQNGLALFLEAVGLIVSPVQLFLSALVMTGIAMSKRKPMAEGSSSNEK